MARRNNRHLVPQTDAIISNISNTQTEQDAQRELRIRSRLEQVYRPSVSRLILLGMLASPVLQLLHLAEGNMSKALGTAIANSQFMRHLLGATNLQDVLQKLRYVTNVEYNNGKITGVSLTDILLAVILNKAPQGLAPWLLSTVQLLARSRLFAPSTVALIGLANQTFGKPQIGMTFGEYLILLSLLSLTTYANDRIKSVVFDSNAELLTKYEQLKRYGISGLVQLLQFTGTGYASIFSGLKDLITLPFSDNVPARFRELLVKLSEGAIILSPVTWFKLFKLATFELLPKQYTVEYLIGLQLINAIVKNFEDTVLHNVLEQLRSSTALQLEYAQLVRQAGILLQRTGRSETQELKRLAVRYYFESGAYKNDERVMAVINEIKNRLPRQSEINALFKKVGLSFVTFEDILNRTIMASDIFGRQLPLLDIDDVDIFDTMTQVILRGLIEAGLELDRLIGFGIYKYQKNGKYNIATILPGWLSVLETAATFAKTTVIPYLGFNPLLSLQPTLLLEYIYKRPVILLYISADQYVPTKDGMRQIKGILEDILYRRLVGIDDTHGNRTRGQLYGLLNQYISTESEVVRQYFTHLGNLTGEQIDDRVINNLVRLTNREEFILLRNELQLQINRLVTGLNNIAQIQNINVDDVTRHLEYAVNNLARLVWYHISEPNDINIRQAKTLLVKTLLNTEKHVQNDLQALENFVNSAVGAQVITQNMFNNTLRFAHSITTQSKVVMSIIDEQLTNAKLIYYGTRPYITIGGHTYDISKYVAEAVNVNKSELSGRMFEVYLLETGTARYTTLPRDKLTAMHKYNMPFITDTNIGDNIFKEFADVITMPIQYNTKLTEVSNLLLSGNMVLQLLGLRRAVRKLNLEHLTTNKVVGLRTQDTANALYGLDEDTVYALLSSFYNIARVTNFLQIQYKIGNLTEEEKQLFEVLTRFLSLNSLEQSVYSLLDRYVQRTKRMPSIEWFSQIVSTSGKTYFDVILEFDAFMSQVLNRTVQILNETIFSNRQLELLSDVRRVAGENIYNELLRHLQNVTATFKYIDVLSSNSEILNFNVIQALTESADVMTAHMLRKARISQILNQVLTDNPHLVIEDELSERMLRLFISTALTNSRAFELRKQFLKSQYVIANELLLVFDAFEPVAITGIGQPYAQLIHGLRYYLKHEINDDWYKNIMEDLFGRTFFENIAMSLRGESIPFFKLDKYRVNVIDKTLLPFNTKEDLLFSDKMEIDIIQNKFILLRPLSSLTSFTDFMHMLLPDITKRKSDVQNISIASIMLHNILGKPGSYLETLGLGRNNLYELVNLLKDFGGLMQKIAWISLGILTLGLVDFLISAVSLGHTSGQQMGGELLTNLYTGLVTLLNAIGIQQFGEYMHYNMPGFIGTLLGLYGLLTIGLPGYFFGLSIGTLLEYIPTVRELVLQVEGVQNVPIYNAQGWEFGSQPYWGYNVKQYRQSLLYMIRKDYQYTPLMYGSRFEYQVFEQPFPTPLNLFGLIPLLTDYYDKKLIGYRPYAYTGLPSGTATPAFLNVPVFASPEVYAYSTMLNMLVRALMPSDNLLETYTREYRLLLEQLSIKSENLVGAIQQHTTDTLQYVQFIDLQLDQARNALMLVHGYMNMYTNNLYNSIKVRQQLMVSDYYNKLEKSRYTIESLLDYMTTYTGFIGFMGQLLISPLSLGTEELTKRMKLATSDYWRTPERLYYQAEVGNILTTTEYIRRLIPNMRRQDIQVNPLENIYLSFNFPWLPEYYKTGDLYLKLSYGEFRLPGPGYEYMRGTVDDYGMIDIYRILLNVSPRSSATKTMEQFIVQYQKLLNVPEYRYIIQQSLEELQTVREGMQTRERVYNMKLEQKTYRVEKYLGEGKLLTQEGDVIEIRGAYFDIDLIAKRVYESKNVTIRQLYEEALQIKTKLEEQLKSYEGSEITVVEPVDIGLKIKWYGSDDFRIQAILPTLEIPTEARRLDTDVDIRLHYKPNIFNSLWESFAHRFGFHNEKYVPIRSAYEEFSRFYYYGMYRTEWNKPFSEVFVKLFLTNIQQNPFVLMQHLFFVGYLLGTTPTISALLGGASLLISGILSIVVPANVQMPQWALIRAQEQQLQLLLYYQGDKGIAKFEQLPEKERLISEIPMYEQQVFSKLLELQLSDYEKILSILPLPMRLGLETVYRAKYQYLAGLVPETEITKEQIEHYERQYIEPGKLMFPDVVSEELEHIDVDLYRLFLFMHNTRNIAMTGTFDTSIMKAKMLITKQMLSTFNSVQSTTKYLKQLAQTDMAFANARQRVNNDPYTTYMYGF